MFFSRCSLHYQEPILELSHQSFIPPPTPCSQPKNNPSQNATSKVPTAPHEDSDSQHPPLLAALLEFAPVAMAVIDPESFEILLSNSELTRFLGPLVALKALAPGYFARMEDYEQLRTLMCDLAPITDHALQLRRSDGTLVNTWVSAKTVIHYNRPARLLKLVPVRPELEQKLQDLQQQNMLLAMALRWTEDVIEIADAEARLEYVNPAFEATTGFTGAEAIGKTPAELFRGGQHDEAFYQAIWQTISNGNVWSGELIGKHKDGSLLHQEAFISPTHDSTGNIKHYVAVKRNITQRKQAAQDLKESEERFRAIAEASPLAIAISWVADDTVLYANPQVESILGLSNTALIGRQTADFYAYPEDRAKVMGLLAQEGSLRNYEIQAKQVNGTLVWVSASLRLLTLNGEMAILSIFSEITERKQAESRLRLMERAIAASSNGIVLTDASHPKNPIIYVNPAFEAMTGYSAAEVLGRNCRFLQGVERSQPALQVLRSSIRSRRECHVTLRNYRKDGTPFWNELHVAPVFDPDGCVTHFVGIQTDISDRKQMEDQLVHAALHDALTHLPNRVLFMNRLTQAISQSQHDPEHRFAMLFLDLDRFKVVNDSLGHIVGDQLLVAIAQRLQTCLPPEATIARFGGDEFTILIDSIRQESDATRIAEHIQQALKVPFTLGAAEVYTSASIGIAFSSAAYARPEEILRDADAALYRAKERGKACLAVFDREMYEQAVVLLQLETDLRRAIERQELRVQYQPIVSLYTGKVVGFEALVRWQHPQRGLVTPDQFIPIAEETGLILPIGQWVLQEACQQLRQWQQQFPSRLPLTMSVNLSAKQFYQPDLAKQIAHILQQTAIEPATLKLEITESGIMENDQSSVELLNHLQDLQVPLCVDDFGTGYSSLSRLHHFPINTLKIDRAFIRAMSVGEDTEIVRAIITLAQNLGMEVVAEGIETLSEWVQLRHLGCDFGQGYFFAKPLDVEAAEALLSSALPW